MAPITSFFAPKVKKTRPKDSESDGKLNSNGKREAPPTDDGNDSNSKRTKALSNEDLAPQVKELVSYLHEDPSNDDSVTWRKKLQKHISSPGFARLSKFVSKERTNNTIYPPSCDVFSALNLTPFNKVKVVIMGQDPYHGPNQGHGLCFSVRKGVQIPPSLKNIYKELLNDEGVEFQSRFGGKMPTHGNLERWAKQGVLLLNSVLTVRRGEANSHKNKGWETFTDEVIRVLDRTTTSQQSRGLVFLLWGKPASKKTQSIVCQGRKHKIICTSHPSPLGATKTNSPFLGSKCFSRCNGALKEMGQEPIDWNVDGDL